MSIHIYGIIHCLIDPSWDLGVQQLDFYILLGIIC